jgi:hypothetical protein
MSHNITLGKACGKLVNEKDTGLTISNPNFPTNQIIYLRLMTENPLWPAFAKLKKTMTRASFAPRACCSLPSI